MENKLKDKNSEASANSFYRTGTQTYNCPQCGQFLPIVSHLTQCVCGQISQCSQSHDPRVFNYGVNNGN